MEQRGMRPANDSGAESPEDLRGLAEDIVRYLPGLTKVLIELKELETYIPEYISEEEHSAVMKTIYALLILRITEEIELEEVEAACEYLAKVVENWRVRLN